MLSPQSCGRGNSRQTQNNHSALVRYEVFEKVWGVEKMRLLKKYFIQCRGGLACPPVTRWPARFIHSFNRFMETKTKWRKRLSLYRTVLKGRHTGLPLRLCGYHNYVAQAVGFMQCQYFFNSHTIQPAHGKALHFVLCTKISHNVTPIDLPAQSAALFCPYGSAVCVNPRHRRFCSCKTLFF